MSAVVAEVVAAAAKVVEIGLAIEQGRLADALKGAHDLAVLLALSLPVEALAPYLRPEDKVFADLAADVAEDAKINAAADAAEAAKLAR